jgi:maleate isomerase
MLPRFFTPGVVVANHAESGESLKSSLGAKRLALFSPPWFSAETDQQGARYFRNGGFEVVHNGPADLPSDQQAIEPSELYEWVRAHTPKEAEAVFIGGNGFRAVGIIKALEAALARPVLTANQVTFWHALRLSGTRVPIVDYGQIFGCELPAS